MSLAELGHGHGPGGCAVRVTCGEMRGECCVAKLDGDTVKLGDATLTAHLTAGHTHGATTWTMPVTEFGKTHQVVFYSSLRSPTVLTPPVIDEFKHSFAVVPTLPC